MIHSLKLGASSKSCFWGDKGDRLGGCGLFVPADLIAVFLTMLETRRFARLYSRKYDVMLYYLLFSDLWAKWLKKKVLGNTDSTADPALWMAAELKDRSFPERFFWCLPPGGFFWVYGVSILDLLFNDVPWFQSSNQCNSEILWPQSQKQAQKDRWWSSSLQFSQRGCFCGFGLSFNSVPTTFRPWNKCFSMLFVSFWSMQSLVFFTKHVIFFFLNAEVAGGSYLNSASDGAWVLLVMRVWCSFSLEHKCCTRCCCWCVSCGHLLGCGGCVVYCSGNVAALGSDEDKALRKMAAGKARLKWPRMCFHTTRHLTWKHAILKKARWLGT